MHGCFELTKRSFIFVESTKNVKIREQTEIDAKERGFGQ